MANRPVPIDLAALPRVFGRPRTFDVECPACGTVVLVRTDGRVRKAGVWDPRSSCLTCASCHQTWVVGLALWKAPISRRDRRALPVDQVPDRDELRQLRQLAGALLPGVAAVDTQRRPRHSNLAPVCLCDRLAAPLQHIRRYVEGCPLHDR